MKRKKVKLVCILLIVNILVIVLGISTKTEAASSYYQYVKSGIEQFPESYRERLYALASKYPNWKFQAYYTGISWDELIAKERGDENVHRNRVTNSAPTLWKHCGYVNNGWACASDGIVKYYMDPRNFLNETQIFQFVETSYNEKSQTASAIEQSVKGTFLDRTITCKDFNNNMVTMSYSQIIVEAAKQANISAFYIKSKIIQEVGTGGSGSVSGNYPGHQGYYNFFNYGAYDEGDPVANGLVYAEGKGWDSPYKAIIGGAQEIGSYYINAGQNTAYFNKWDVVGTRILRDGESTTVSEEDLFWHQYMTNIQDPTSQSSSTRKLYENSIQNEITFIIPVYNDMPPYNLIPQDIPVQGLKINGDKIVVLQEDEKRSASVTITPYNATNQDVVWSCSDDSIVRVWGKDYRGLKEGTAIVTATSVDGGYSDSFKVIVRDPNKHYVEKINIEKEQYISYIDEAFDINYTCDPEDSANKELYWTTDNPEVIRVYGNRYRGLKEGIANLIAMTDDEKIIAKSKVVVRDKNKVYVDSITLDKPNYTIIENEAVDVPYTYTPKNASNAEFYWTSSNPEVLSVWGNRFRGLQPGTAQIIGTTLDGTVEGRATVVVNKALVKEIIPEKEEYEIGIDEAVDIPFTYTPENAKNAEFYWSSTNDDVLRVFGNRFRGLKPGTEYVVVKTLDGTVEKRIKVTIKNEKPGPKYVTEIKPEKEEYEIGIDEAVDVPFTYTPEDAINAEFYWESSNDDVLRVFGNRFRGLQPGTAYVIVTTLDGKFEKRIKVTVKSNGSQYVTDLITDKTEYTVNVDEAIDITYSYLPSNAENAEFYWTSSNDEIIRVFGNRFRGLKPGTADVIVNTLDGKFEKRIKVTVKN